LRLAADAPFANLCARLVDVHPDGIATRVTFGVLNLAHRDGNAEPQPLTPGKWVEVSLTLDACGYRFALGHRIRLALSTAYWPMILPPPADAALELDLASIRLHLPLLGEHERMDVPEPLDADPLPRYESLETGRSEREVERNLTTGVTCCHIFEDTGLNRHPDNGLATRDIREETWSITLGDPLSATGSSHWTCITEREGWSTKTLASSTLSCTETDWIVTASVEGFENGRSVFSRQKEKKIRRDMM
jgi:hypothetical protein